MPHRSPVRSPSEFLALWHESRILGHSFNPVCGLSMMEQVRLCVFRPMENWLSSSLNQIQGWTTVRESYSRALEQGPLLSVVFLSAKRISVLFSLNSTRLGNYLSQSIFRRFCGLTLTLNQTKLCGKMMTDNRHVNIIIELKQSSLH